MPGCNEGKGDLEAPCAFLQPCECGKVGACQNSVYLSFHVKSDSGDSSLALAVVLGKTLCSPCVLDPRYCKEALMHRVCLNLKFECSGKSPE